MPGSKYKRRVRPLRIWAILEAVNQAAPIDEPAIGRPDQPGRSPWQVAPSMTFAIVGSALLLLTVVGLASNSEPIVTSQAAGFQPTVVSASRVPTDGAHDAPPIVETETREPPATPPRLPGIVAIIAAAIVGLVALNALRGWITGNSVRWRLSTFLDGRFGAGEPDEVEHEPDAEELATLAGALRDRLLSTNDPRLAIQQAYAAVESGFGVEQLARHATETPLTYLHRVFGRVGAVREPLARLTSLFEVARFSTQPVTLSMRDEAAEALDDVRTIYLDKSTQDQLDDACSG